MKKEITAQIAIEVCKGLSEKQIETNVDTVLAGVKTQLISALLGHKPTGKTARFEI